VDSSESGEGDVGAAFGEQEGGGMNRTICGRAEFLAYWTQQWLLYGKVPPGVEQDVDGNLQLVDRLAFSEVLEMKELLEKNQKTESDHEST